MKHAVKREEESAAKSREHYDAKSEKQSALIIFCFVATNFTLLCCSCSLKVCLFVRVNILLLSHNSSFPYTINLRKTISLFIATFVQFY